MFCFTTKMVDVRDNEKKQFSGFGIVEGEKISLKS